MVGKPPERNNSLDLTKEVFEPLYGHSLTDDEAFNVRKNLVSFFETLPLVDALRTSTVDFTKVKVNEFLEMAA